MVQNLLKKIEPQELYKLIAQCRPKINQMAKRKFKNIDKKVIKIDKSLKITKLSNN